MHKKIKDLLQNQKLLYLSGEDVRTKGVYDFQDHLPNIESVYKVHYRGDFRMPLLDYLKYKDRPSYDRIIVLLGYLGEPFSVSGLKQICSSTSNSKYGFPRASGLVLLNDPDTQRPFAILEAAQISAVRTATVTGVAIKNLSRSKFGKIAVVGCGYLAKVHMKMWHSLFRDRGERFHIFDKVPEALPGFQKHVADLGMETVVCKSAEEAIRDADLVMTLTTEEEPYVRSEWMKKQSLYCAVSLLDPELEVLSESDTVVVDDLDLCTHEGRPLEKIKRKGMLEGMTIHTMGEVLTKGIELDSGKSRIYFNPMGTVLTDLAVASHIVGRALSDGAGVVLPV